MIKPLALFTLIAALIWVAKLSFGQNELKVKTLDSDEQPLSAVLIKLKLENGQEAVEVSDNAGNTSFELSDTGTFTISAHFIGDEEKQELHLDTGSHAITIHFERKELNTVIVEDTRQNLFDGEDWGSHFHLNRRVGAASLGGVWFPNTRAPTFDNLLNRQPND